MKAVRPVVGPEEDAPSANAGWSLLRRPIASHHNACTRTAPTAP